MYKKITFLCFLFLLPSIIFSQTTYVSKKNKVVIPFELTHDVMIIGVNVNNVKLKMIFDTGSENNILFSAPVEDIEFLNSRKITLHGLGIGDEIEAHLSSINKLEINGIVDANFEILLITDQNIGIINKFGVPINGIIGTSFFKDFLIEIDYQRERLIFHKKKTKKITRKLKKYTSDSISLINNKAFIDIQTSLDNKTTYRTKLLLDSGLGDGIWLFENDSIKCTTKYITDFLGRGLSGEILGKRTRVKELKLKEFILDSALVSFPNIKLLSKFDIKKERNGSLGGSILKRFNWFLDYSNRIVYFKKNSLFSKPFNYNMSGIEVQHMGLEWELEKERKNNSNTKQNLDEFFFDNANAKYNINYVLKPKYEVFSVRKNSNAEIEGVLPGDILISINGKKASSLTLQKIIDIFQSKDGKEMTIEVERDQKIYKFDITLEKQI